MNQTLTILVVEDDRRIHRIIANYLNKEQYTIISAYSFREAYEQIFSNKIDIACIDLMLPDGDGVELCQLIKSNDSKTGVIILSKKSQIADRLNCFRSGADDYISKPFFPEELIARIKRFSKTDIQPVLKHSCGLELNLHACILKLDENACKVTRLETMILRLLISSSGYLTLEEIQEQLSELSIKYHTQSSLKVAISRLKSKIKREWGREVVKSRYGVGYYIVS